LIGIVPLRRWPPTMRIRSMTIIPPEAVYGRLRPSVLARNISSFPRLSWPVYPPRLSPASAAVRPVKVSDLSGFFQSERHHPVFGRETGLFASKDWREGPPPA